MHINRHNFESSFPLIKASIESADFISIDTELSGLHSDRAHGPDLTDTLSHRYTNTRRSARDFSLVQYGLCTFTKASSTTFTCRPFNFPLFPASTVVLGSGSEESRAQPTSKTFMVQPSAFEFLAKNRFDFAKWVNEGIPYLNLTDEAVMREKEGKGHHVKTTIAVNEKSIGFLKKIINKVDKWVMESVGEKCAFVRVSEDNKQRVISEVKKRFSDYLEVEDVKSKLLLRRLSDEENVELDVIDHMKGFTRIMEILASAGKPIIGHNLLLDLCHTYDKFFKTLPKTLSEFKTSVTELFPIVYDTKLISTSPLLNCVVEKTFLEALYERCGETPFEGPEFIFPEGFEGYQQTGSSLEAKFHEAGYDAFVTGCCFARMVKYIVEDSGDSGEEWFESEVVTRFRNKLYLMRSGTAFLDLEKDEEPQDPSYTFFLHNLPRDWSTPILHRHLLSRAIPLQSLRRVSDTSFFVHVSVEMEAVKALRMLRKGSGNKKAPYRVQSLEQFEKEMERRREERERDMGKEEEDEGEEEEEEMKERERDTGKESEDEEEVKEMKERGVVARWDDGSGGWVGSSCSIL